MSKDYPYMYYPVEQQPRRAGGRLWSLSTKMTRRENKLRARTCRVSSQGVVSTLGAVALDPGSWQAFLRTLIFSGSLRIQKQATADPLKSLR